MYASILCYAIPALITSTPVGYQRSPGRSRSSTVLLGSVLKYSPSSTCVPSDSSTSRTGSEAGTPSFSRPVSIPTSVNNNTFTHAYIHH